MDRHLIDLREERLDLLRHVYDGLLQVHFPVPGELDDFETMISQLQQPVDGLNPELHVLVLMTGDEPMGCACYEYYPRGNHCLISYICVAEAFRRQGVSKVLMERIQAQLAQRAEKPLAAIFAETHSADVIDGIMDPLERQEVLAALGFRCLDFDYTQPPLSERHEPCGGLRLLVKDQDALPREAVVPQPSRARGVVDGARTAIEDHKALVSAAAVLVATHGLCAQGVCCLGCLSLVPGFLRRVVNGVAFFPPRPPGYHVTEDRQVFLVESDYGLSPLPDLAQEGIVVDTVRMWTRRGNVILGFHFKRADSSRTILFSHGNSTDIGIMFYHLREMCSRLQCDVFAYEYSGYGESTGQPTELDLYADIEAAYHYLSNDCSLADEQIVCYGQSIGSVPSVELASRVTLGGLILHSAMKSGLSVIHNVKTTYWFDVFQNAARMKKVTSPTFVIHGTQDGEIPFEHGSALWDALPKELAYEPWWVMEAGHNDIEMNHRRAGWFLLPQLGSEGDEVTSPLRPVAYLPSPEHRSLSPDVFARLGPTVSPVRPSSPGGLLHSHDRDRSSSPDARLPTPLVPPFALQGRISRPAPAGPQGPQGRPLTPDSRELLKRAQLPSSNHRIPREPSHPTLRSRSSSERPLVLEAVTPIYTGRGAPGTTGYDTRSRTITRSASPMVAMPLDYSRSRPHTPYRSVSPSHHVATTTAAASGVSDPRATSPCRVYATHHVLRQQVVLPQAEGARHIVTPYGPQFVQGHRVTSVLRPSPLQGSQSNTSTISSMQAMSVQSGQSGAERASPPIPSECPRPSPGSYLPQAGVGTSPSGAPLLPSAELSEGAVLSIGSGGQIRVKKPLGMGSFGAVWEAEQTSGGPNLALKEILCPSQVDLVNAMFEGSLLESFKGKDPKANSACILPVLVGLDSTPIAKDLYRVRLAMTRLPGQPLDAFLRVKMEEAQQRRQRPPSDASRVESMKDSVILASELLQQLAPAFEEHIAHLAYHRDVNAHNILIDFEGNQPKYGLVDFGLAVDVQSWQGDLDERDAAGAHRLEGRDGARQTRVGQDGATTWHHLDVGGDCRYWPVSAWVQFLLGWTELDCNPMLRSEYRTRLDMHSLGLTSLQVLVDTMPADLSLSASHTCFGLFNELHTLRSAWDRYWNMVTPLHTRLMETFHNGGDWDVLKAHCLESNVHEAIAQELRQIRSSLLRARGTLTSTRGSGFRETCWGLLTALLLLIGCGEREREGAETLGPSAEEVPGPMIWRQVRMALADGPGGLSPHGHSPGPKTSPSRTSSRQADLRLNPLSGPRRTSPVNGDVKRTAEMAPQTMLEKVDWMIANDRAMR
ncbi:Alpha/beta hydrolase domain-containing protein aho-3 (Abnormal hunger orientation protein 3) [Durusdinium trenchii]|uniref:Alpha/beta hydrolase domain-containing protein aho-3 (Abnormal hunger orientation protein 3) n=1 Tax=Durusdinium trenchii TaxID=1381693 RepID=A0ABP0PUU7_9DINO